MVGGSEGVILLVGSSTGESLKGSERGRTSHMLEDSGAALGGGGLRAAAPPLGGVVDRFLFFFFPMVFTLRMLS